MHLFKALKRVKELCGQTSKPLKFVRMGKVDFFVVEFYGGKRTFYPGEALNGTLRLKVNKELKLRGIRLEFHGKASIHWSESTGSGENRRTRHYRNSETYIDTLATLFGKAPGQDGDDPVLQPGDYSYPFQFLIPNQNMPTSVEGRHGYIRYWLKGVIDRPWRFDITTTAVFTMLEYVDINTLPLLQPCQMSEDRNVGCLCCKSGPLSVTVYTDRGGYCPGESIGVSAVINNHSDNEILGLEIHLIQVTVYIASTGKRKHCEDKVAAMLQEGVKPHEETRMPMVAFPIPSLPPSMLSCRCMRMSYVLRLKVRVKGALNSNLNIPITIGSVPYRPPMQPQYPQPAAGNFGGPPPPLTGFSEPSSYPAPSPQFGDGTQPYPNYAPPSYAECVSGGASITNEGDSGKALGDSTFTPMYPFVNNYQFPSAPPAPFPQDPKSQ